MISAIRILALVLALAAPVLAQAQTVLAVLGGTAQGADDGGAVLSIDPATGAGTVLGTPVPGEGLTGIAALPDGRVFVSVAGSSGGDPRLVQIDPDTGDAVQTVGVLSLGGTPAQVHDLAASPAGQLYGVLVGGNRELVQINPADATMTVVGTPAYGTDDGFVAIAFTADGTLWAHEANGNEYWTLNPATGAVASGPFANTASPDPGYAIGTIALGAVSPGELLLADCCNGPGLGNDIYRLDLATGVATLLGSAGGNRRVHDFTVAGTGGGGVLPPVPQPAVIPTLSPWALALAALLLLVPVFLMRRSS